MTTARLSVVIPVVLLQLLSWEPFDGNEYEGCLKAAAAVVLLSLTLRLIVVAEVLMRSSWGEEDVD